MRVTATPHDVDVSNNAERDGPSHTNPSGVKWKRPTDRQTDRHARGESHACKAIKADSAAAGRVGRARQTGLESF